MKNAIAFLLLVLWPNSSLIGQQSNSPRFEDYHAAVFNGRKASVHLEKGEAHSFRTRLREGAKEGVNFAGHYTLVSWGCGAGCLVVGIIDVMTGKVYFPKELNGFGVWFWDNDDRELTFKPDSSLLRMSGYPASEMDKDNPECGIYYYQWLGQRMKLIKREMRKCETR